jgi:acetolactate synthase-1/2/3 large subunit
VKMYEALARAFADEGTDAVFTMMGDANMYWLNALAQLDVRLFDVRHEGAGLAMADGYARATRRPGVCSTTGGPGTTQLATTMVVAARARSPLVAFCGDSARDGHDAQRFDQRAFAAAVEAAFVRIDRAEDAYTGVSEAFSIARCERRPVMLSVPQDIQQLEVVLDRYQPSFTEATDPAELEPDPDEIERAADLIRRSKRPVILVGRGAKNADAGAVVATLAERVGALVATTLLAKNWLNDDPFHLGIAGGYGTKTARRLLADADCLIAAGASVSPYTSDSGALFRNATVIQIDDRPAARMGDGRAADCVVRADARTALDAIDRRLAETEHNSTGRRTPDVAAELARAYVDESVVELEPGTVDPRAACAVIDSEIPADISLILGSGQQIRFPTMLLRRQRPVILAQHHFGCIGQGLTTAMGAVIATGSPGFVIEGDAGLMMHLSEFETAVRYGLPLLVIVMNDEALGAEYHKSIAVGLDGDLTLIGTPDLGRVGRSLGGRGRLVQELDALTEAVREFVADPAPTMVDVRISRRVLSIPYRRAYYGADV